MSIRDRQVIDLRVAPNVPVAEPRLEPIYDNSKYRAPLVVGIFGANGAGKSNVLRALSFIAAFAYDSFSWSQEFEFPFQKFGDVESRNAPTKLALHFGGPRDLAEVEQYDQLRAECSYSYELELAALKPGRVIKEALYFYPNNVRRRLFERTESGTKYGPAFGLTQDFKAIDTVLRPNASIISTLAQLNHPESMALKYAANTFSSNIGLIRHEPTDEYAVAWYQKNPHHMEDLNRDISRLDVGIKNVNFVNVPGKLTTLAFEHAGLTEPVTMALESHGTRQFLRIFPHIIFALRYGGVAIVDELDANIHPLLLPEIMRWFYDTDRNPLRAQLWITCQAASLLEELSKEQIFFCEKDAEGRSSIFGLRDIKSVRRIDNFYKKYLGGSYGAIPRVG